MNEFIAHRHRNLSKKGRYFFTKNTYLDYHWIPAKSWTPHSCTLVHFLGYTINWEGSEEIYSNLWICNSIHEMAQKIHNLNICNLTAFHAANQLRLYHKEMQPERIALSILESLKGGSNEP